MISLLLSPLLGQLLSQLRAHGWALVCVGLDVGLVVRAGGGGVDCRPVARHSRIHEVHLAENLALRIATTVPQSPQSYWT